MLLCTAISLPIRPFEYNQKPEKYNFDKPWVFDTDDVLNGFK